MLESHTFQIFHGDERQAVLFANVVNGADVGMVQSRSGLCLALKAVESLGIASDVIGQEFQSNKAV